MVSGSVDLALRSSRGSPASCARLELLLATAHRGERAAALRVSVLVGRGGRQRQLATGGGLRRPWAGPEPSAGSGRARPCRLRRNNGATRAGVFFFLLAATRGRRRLPGSLLPCRCGATHRRVAVLRPAPPLQRQPDGATSTLSPRASGLGLAFGLFLLAQDAGLFLALLGARASSSTLRRASSSASASGRSSASRMLGIGERPATRLDLFRRRAGAGRTDAVARTRRHPDAFLRPGDVPARPHRRLSGNLRAPCVTGWRCRLRLSSSGRGRTALARLDHDGLRCGHGPCPGARSPARTPGPLQGQRLLARHADRLVVFGIAHSVSVPARSGSPGLHAHRQSLSFIIPVDRRA
jgi:hypothetical protein